MAIAATAIRMLLDFRWPPVSNLIYCTTKSLLAGKAHSSNSSQKMINFSKLVL